MSERFVSACSRQILVALSKIHKGGIIHCNLDLDHVLCKMMPFGGDHFRVVDFDNARLVGANVHPVFQNEKARQ